MTRFEEISCSRVCSDLFPWHLEFESQWIGQTVGQVGHANEQVEVNNLRIAESLLPQRGDIGVAYAGRSARQLLGEGQRGLFFGAERSGDGILQVLPVVGGQAGSLRRSEVVLQSILAPVQQGDAYIDHLVEPALQRAAHARIKG